MQVSTATPPWSQLSQSRGRGVLPRGVGDEDGELAADHHQQRGRQVDREGTTLDEAGDLEGEPFLAEQQMAEDTVGGGPGDAAGELGDGVPGEEEARTGGPGDGGQEQREAEPVPERQVVGVLGGRVGVGVRGEQPVGQADGGAEDQAEDGEQGGRGEEGPADAVHGGVGDAGLAGEGAPDEAQGVRGGQRRAHDDDGQRPPVGGGAVEQRLERGFLGGEAEQRRQGGHGGGGEDGDPGDVRQ